MISRAIITDEFTLALRDYARAVPKWDTPYIVNRAAFNIAAKAIQESVSARKQDLDRLRKNPAFVRMVLKRMWNMKQPTNKAALDAEMQRVISARKRKIGWRKAGYIPLLQTTGQAIRRTVRARGASKTAKTPGMANRAQSGWNPTADFRNLAENIGQDPRFVGALRRAINRQTNDMKNFTAKRMQARANKYNTR